MLHSNCNYVPLISSSVGHNVKADYQGRIQEFSIGGRRAIANILAERPEFYI